jgi:small subunit ribosomal protein S2
MAPYIFGKRNMIHIIDIRETVKGLLRAKKYLAQVVANGQDVLFVGTKRQAKQLVQDYASKCGMHSVSERWLGGTLTNFRTIRSRLNRLVELEDLESTGSIKDFSKKRVSSLMREKKKITRNLDGVRNMGRLPGVLFVIDPRKEHIAVKEARKLGIPTVCLLDTDADPDFADIPIPGNDDAIRSIEIILRELADAVEEGKRGRVAPREAAPAAEAVASAAAGPARRRVRREPEGSVSQPEGQAPEAPAPAPVSIPEAPAEAPLGEPGQPNP